MSDETKKEITKSSSFFEKITQKEEVLIYGGWQTGEKETCLSFRDDIKIFDEFSPEEISYLKNMLTNFVSFVSKNLPDFFFVVDYCIFHNKKDYSGKKFINDKLLEKIKKTKEKEDSNFAKFYYCFVKHKDNFFDSETKPIYFSMSAFNEYLNTLYFDYKVSNIKIYNVQDENIKNTVRNINLNLSHENLSTAIIDLQLLHARIYTLHTDCDKWYSHDKYIKDSQKIITSTTDREKQFGVRDLIEIVRIERGDTEHNSTKRKSWISSWTIPQVRFILNIYMDLIEYYGL